MKMRKLLTGVVAAAMAVSTFAFAAVAEDAAPTVYTYKPTKEGAPSYVYHVTETFNFAPVKAWATGASPVLAAATANSEYASGIVVTGLPAGTTFGGKAVTAANIKNYKVNGVALNRNAKGDALMPSAAGTVNTTANYVGSIVNASKSVLLAGIQNTPIGVNAESTAATGAFTGVSKFSAGVYNSLTVTYDVVLDDYDYLLEDVNDARLNTVGSSTITLVSFTAADVTTQPKIAANDSIDNKVITPSAIKVDPENVATPDASGYAEAKTYTNVNGGNMFSFKIAECESLLKNGATLTFTLTEATKNEGFVNFFTDLNDTKMGVWFNKGATTSTITVPASYMAKELGSEYQQNIITFMDMMTEAKTIGDKAIKVASIDLAIAPLAVSDDLDDVQGNPGEGEDADLAEDEEEIVEETEEEIIEETEEEIVEETDAPTDDKNQPTGVALAIVPVAIAGAAAIVAKKRK